MIEAYCKRIHRNCETPELTCLECLLDKIRQEIAEYKDDKIIHAERNEMIDIVLEIIDKYGKGAEK